MRPLVSYDDISWPTTTTEASSPKPQQPPSKKRKKSYQKPKHQSHHVQHWDDPGTLDESMSYGDDGRTSDGNTGADMNNEEETEESRELTYEEIWDDSALIDAWNAATEEYEAFHGTDKKWKKESLHKSPLWYNVPHPPPNLQPTKNGAPAEAVLKPTVESEDAPDADSRPLNFDTFVPSHDPSLANPVPPYPAAQGSTYSLPDPPDSVVSQDEAFARALDAMYWAGYYSAVYHCRRNNICQKRPAEDEGDEQDYDENQNDEDVDKGLIPTQR
jgi:hypothetical protein